MVRMLHSRSPVPQWPFSRASITMSPSLTVSGSKCTCRITRVLFTSTQTIADLLDSQVQLELVFGYVVALLHHVTTHLIDDLAQFVRRSGILLSKGLVARSRLREASTGRKRNRRNSRRRIQILEHHYVAAICVANQTNIAIHLLYRVQIVSAECVCDAVYDGRTPIYSVGGLPAKFFNYKQLEVRAVIDKPIEAE